MDTRKRVLVYGRSLNLAGITACLKLDNSLLVMVVNPQNPESKQVLDDFCPDTIIYDLLDKPSDLDVNLLKEIPGLLLIGVDPSSNEVLVLSGQRNSILSTDELVHLILYRSEYTLNKNNSKRK